MKTVKELIEFLKTQDPDKKIMVSYDGMESDLNIMNYAGLLCFSNDVYTPDYECPEILFKSKVKE